MHKLKSYVRNKARPEGSIAEGYIDNECLNFCSLYYNNMETKWNRHKRNYDAHVHNLENTVSVFQTCFRPFGGRISDKLTEIEWKQLRWYVLNNCVEVQPFIRYFSYPSHCCEIEVINYE